MKAPFQPEMLSDLLDGRLDAAQQREVEEYLEQHPEDARLFEDLKSIRAGLREIPTLKLRSDLAPQIMQRLQPASRSAVARIPAAAIRIRWRQVATIASLAASVAIVAFLVTRLNQGQVAQAPPAADAASPLLMDKQAASGFASKSAAGQSALLGAAADMQPDAPNAREPGDEIAAKGGRVQLVTEDPAMPMAVDPESYAVPADTSVVDNESPQAQRAQQESDWMDDALAADASGSQGKVEEKELMSLAETDPELALPAPVESLSLAENANDVGVAEDFALDGKAQPELNAPSVRGFDHVIFVQAPVDQSAEQWIGQVFAQANVQLVEGDGATLRQRMDFWKSNTRDSEALAPGQKDADVDSRQLAVDDLNQPSAAPETASQEELGDANQLADATRSQEAGGLGGGGFDGPADSPLQFIADADGCYYVEGSLEQLQVIIDQMEGATLAGVGQGDSFGREQNFYGERELSKEAFQARGAIARRLAPMLILEMNSADRAEAKQDQLTADERREIDRGSKLESLGIVGQSPEQFVRVLFVLQSTEMAAPEPAPASSDQ